LGGANVRKRNAEQAKAKQGAGQGKQQVISSADVCIVAAQMSAE